VILLRNTSDILKLAKGRGRIVALKSGAFDGIFDLLIENFRNEGDAGTRLFHFTIPGTERSPGSQESRDRAREALIRGRSGRHSILAWKFLKKLGIARK
jgi:hypothetical protein